MTNLIPASFEAKAWKLFKGFWVLANWVINILFNSAKDVMIYSELQENYLRTSSMKVAKRRIYISWHLQIRNVVDSKYATWSVGSIWPFIRFQVRNFKLWWNESFGDFPWKRSDKGDVCCLPYSDFILISMIQLSSWLGVVANECSWRLANPKDPPIHLILGLSLCTFSMVAWTRQVMWSPFLWFL